MRTTPPASLTLLALADTDDELVYDARLRQRFGGVDLVVGCGDLRAGYLDYVVSTLNVPLFYVNGNHDPGRPAPAPPWLARGAGGAEVHAHGIGGTDLHARGAAYRGLLLAGLEGCRRYNDGPHQYTELEMGLQVARLVPRLLLNRLRHGRYLDVLVTHAPPRHIHDREDPCHRGFRVFRWLLRTFHPLYHLHGHVHVYSNLVETRTMYHTTTVLNAYGHRVVQVPLPAGRLAPGRARGADDA